MQGTTTKLRASQMKSRLTLRPGSSTQRRRLLKKSSATRLKAEKHARHQAHVREKEQARVKELAKEEADKKIMHERAEAEARKAAEAAHKDDDDHDDADGKKSKKTKK